MFKVNMTVNIKKSAIMRKELKELTNGCSRTEVYYSPKDCLSLSSKSNFSKNWFVECRFHDPKFKDQYPKGFQFRAKFSGEDLQQLKLDARAFKKQMEKKLDEMNYNPITKQYMTERKGAMHPYLPFIKALQLSKEKLKSSWSKDHAYEVSRCITHVDNIKDSLKFSELLISEIRTWHIKTILDELNLTDSVFNKSRSYLQSLFKELTQYGCCEVNPIDNITKRVEVKKIREVITKEKLRFVMEYLKVKHYTFFRYANIFHYSAARTAELFRVQKKHIDFDNQEYSVLIKKGRQYIWVKKIIIPAAVPYWKEIISLCKNEEDFLFSKNLSPGPAPLQTERITRIWKDYVKDSDEIKDDKGNIIKVTEDFYTLKHLFLDILDEMNTAPIIPIAGPAQRMANHTTENTTNIYTGGKEARKNADLKNLKIS